MKNKLTYILLILLILITSALLTLTIIGSKNGSGNNQLSAEMKIKIASDYHNNELYIPAIEFYEQVVLDESLQQRKRSNILYTVAEIYKDELQDYEGALKSYLLLRHMFPDHGLSEDVEKAIIECLDNLGRSAQAQSRL